MESNKWVLELRAQLREAGDPEIAAGQKAYMRDQFVFYGVKTPERRQIQRNFLNKKNLPLKRDLVDIVKQLWEAPERENQYIAQELARKYIRDIAEDDYLLYEYMITNKSWWDTVDFIAVNLLGAYFKKYPNNRLKLSRSWIRSGNIWLQRSTLLFQLKYKTQLDIDFLEETIISLNGTKEFFINKAIGWVLREYSRTNAPWVLKFVEKTKLHSLSKREAVRLIKGK